MASNSYLDPSRRYLSPLVTHGRSPSSSSSARTMYSSTTSSSRTSSGYHQPSSGSQQASTGTHVGYSRNGGYNNPPEVQRYRDPGNDAKYTTTKIRNSGGGKTVEVIHQSDRQPAYEPYEPRSSQATSSDIRSARNDRNYDYGGSYSHRR